MLLLMLLFFSDPVPIKVTKGDPVFDIPLVSMNEKVTNLNEVIVEGFAFFLTPECKYCAEAIPNIKSHLEDQPYILIFMGDPEKIKKIIAEHSLDFDQTYMAKEEHLLPYNLITYPAVVAYESGQCKTAMHGPMTEKSLTKLINFYQGNYSIKKLEKKQKAGN